MAAAFRFTKKELLKLFLVCAAPLHIWTIFVILSDVSLIEKRNLWYFAGYSGYLLGMALLESGLLFLFVLALSFLFPKSWQPGTPLAIASAFALVIALWAIGNQVYFSLEQGTYPWYEWIMLRVHYRQKLGYYALIVLVTLSAAVPAAVLWQSKDIRTVWLGFLDNLSLLSYLYLALDLFGFAAIALRNIF